MAKGILFPYDVFARYTGSLIGCPFADRKSRKFHVFVIVTNWFLLFARFFTANAHISFLLVSSLPTLISIAIAFVMDAAAPPVMDDAKLALMIAQHHALIESAKHLPSQDFDAALQRAGFVTFKSAEEEQKLRIALTNKGKTKEEVDQTIARCGFPGVPRPDAGAVAIGETSTCDKND